MTETRIFAFILAICIFVPILSFPSSARTLIWEEGFYGYPITVNEITLGNGTVAWKWVSGEYSSTEKAEIKNYVMNSYDIFTQLYAGDATVKYNCHSYAWYSQAINNQYWINNPQKYREGNWLKSTGWTDLIPSGIKAGDVVDYYITETNRPHSAVVYSLVLNLFSSKWGSAGLYVHKPTEVPAGYISRDLGYYRL